MAQIDLRYTPENDFITSINEKIVEFLRTASGNITFRQLNENNTLSTPLIL
jgi:hypothetical protein